MKTKLLFIVFCSIILSSLSAQDTLKVNFKPAGTPGNAGWDSILVSDKTAYTEGYASYSKFGGTVQVKPVWFNSPVAENVRAVDRTSKNYTGPLTDILRSYIAVDSRYSNDCGTIGVEITGLPTGTYTFESYHHDYRDQYGSFSISTDNGAKNLDKDHDGKMISHSLDLAKFEETYQIKLDESVAIEYVRTYVVNSLDSVTKYTFDKIVSSGTSDVIVVSFENVLTPDPDMSHNLKFVLINGFKLYESSANGIENRMLNPLSVYPNPASKILHIDFQSEIGHKVFISIIDITGKTVLKNIAELSTINKHCEIDISNLDKGIYFLRAKASANNIITKKLIIE